MELIDEFLSDYMSHLNEDYKKSYTDYDRLYKRTLSQKNHLRKTARSGEFDSTIYENGDFSIAARFLGFKYFEDFEEEPYVTFIFNFSIGKTVNLRIPLKGEHDKETIIQYFEGVLDDLQDGYSKTKILDKEFNDNLDDILKVIDNFLENTVKRLIGRRDSFDYASASRDVNLDRMYSQFRKEFEDEYTPEVGDTVFITKDDRFYEIEDIDGNKVTIKDFNGKIRNVTVDYIKRFGEPGKRMLEK